MIEAGAEGVKVSENFRLACPNCGDDGGLHQTVVEVYQPDPMHPAHGVYVTVAEGEVGVGRVEMSAYDNPGDDRDGLVVQFKCEHCHGQGSMLWPFALNIGQHKGITEMWWSPVRDMREPRKYLTGDNK